MNDTTDWDLLARYLSGESSVEENKKVEAWLQQDPENRKSIDFMKRVWETRDSAAEKSDVDRLWSELAEKTEITAAIRKIESGRAPRHQVRTGGDTSPQRSSMYRYLRIAAVFLAVVSALYFYTNVINSPDMVELMVENGKRTKLTLADGSIITLDAGSKFTYPEKFSGISREVFLHGEGFFEVSPDAQKPFIVHANGAVIEVLGTEFNVRAWNQENSVEVAVADGKVSFRSEISAERDAGVIITKGRMSILKENGSPSEPRQIDVEKYLAWLNYEREFSSAPLREVLDQLERWYDVQIQLADESAASELITVYIEKKPIEDVLEMISLIMNMNFERNGSTIVFSPDISR